MRVATKLAAVASGAALVMTISACGSVGGADASGGASAGADGAPAGSLPHVQPDPEAVKLLPADLQKGGSITMAADLHYPPTSFLAEDNKTPIGYNVDIAHLLGEKLGLEVEVKNVTWDGVIPGIASRRYDFTATNMSPTPERLKVLNMITYWSAGSSLVVAKGNPLKLSLADQSLCGKKIAVMTGSTQQETYVPEISKTCQTNGAEAVDAVVLPNVQGALTQLASKRIDGVFSDTSQMGWAAKQQPQAFELVSPQYKKKEGDDIVALGVAKDSPLAPALHAAMQSLMAGPAYKAALEKWGLGTGAIPTSELLK
jgi:polar amino acid transport system substrate-binding protein